MTETTIAKDIEIILSMANSQDEATEKLTELRKSAILGGVDTKMTFDRILEKVRKVYDKNAFDGLNIEFYYDFSDFQSTDDPYTEILTQKNIFLYNQNYARIAKNAVEVGYKNFPKTFKAFKSTHKVVEDKDGNFGLELDEKGKPKNTIDNFIKILEQDEYFKMQKIKFNVFAYIPEYTNASGKICRWEDADDAKARHYIEKNYGLYSHIRYSDAIRIVHANNQYHPVQDYIKSLVWDGTDRISDFLVKWAKCENSAYTREVSRLIFAGGINRIFRAGCKFDLVPVLVGKQGSGKTTLVERLAVSDEWANKLKTIENNKGFEAIQGSWIVEMGEMEALKGAKDNEQMKDFISERNDRIRLPYDKRTTDHYRQCIFIGTSNTSRFIADKTGGRRWLPVEVHSDGRDFFIHADELKHDIDQYWAEAYAKINSDFMSPAEDIDLLDIIRQMQSDATEDDFRVGIIEEFLQSRSVTCIKELWCEALEMDKPPTKRESAEIGLIMDFLDGWERQNNLISFSAYGRQRCWKRTSVEEEHPEIIP